jgi:hypothetical protein
MIASRCAVVALALMTSGATVSAQTPEALAISTSKQASKDALKELKAGIKSALATLDADLDAIEPQFTGTTSPSQAITLLADAVIAAQDSLATAMDTAIATMNEATSSALDDLSGGGDLFGIYPVPLYSGTRGPLDKHREAVFKALGKARTSALNRLAKTSALAEEVGLGVTFTLDLPAIAAVAAVNEGIVGLTHLAVFDAAIGVSRLTSSGDGAVFATGRAIAAQDVEVTLFRDGGAEDSGTAEGGPRWSITLDDSGTGLDEGGYAIGVNQETSNNTSAGQIGLR